MIKTFSECNCICHTQKGVYHVVACCYTCPKCGNERATFYHKCKKILKVKSED